MCIRDSPTGDVTIIKCGGECLDEYYLSTGTLTCLLYTSVFSDSVSTNQVLISKALATKIKLKLGDKIYTYYIQDDICLLYTSEHGFL